MSAVETARELERLSLALVEALEAADLDGAAAVLAERDRLLEMASPPPPRDRAALAPIARVVHEADRRARSLLGVMAEEARAGLGALRVGAEAARAYRPEPLGAGYVDRHG
jgi:hypothetical protein